MALTIAVPSVLFDRTNEWYLHIDATSVREAIDVIEKRHPGFASDVLVGPDQVRPSLSIVADGRPVSTATDLDRVLPDNCKVDIVRRSTGG